MDSSDDCFTQDVGIAINGRISPFGESSLAEKGPKTVANTRKRKMDEEGFVTPATPDIPKSSLKYGLPSHKLYEAAYDDPAEVGAAGDAESEDPEEGFHRDGERQDTDGNVVGSISKVGAEDTAETGNGSSADSALKRYDSVSDLFEDVAQETKMILIQLAQSFRESEEYEGACVSELEKLASEAVDLEKMVSQQKDLLRHRLAMIGRRLEQGEEQD